MYRRHLVLLHPCHNLPLQAEWRVVNHCITGVLDSRALWSIKGAALCEPRDCGRLAVIVVSPSSLTIIYARGGVVS